MPQAIDILKKHFDYIILDTAPIGMVTDTLLISRVANASIYVCRADYTHKADYTLINELSEQKKTAQPMYHYQRTGHEEKRSTDITMDTASMASITDTVKNTVTAMDMALKM